MFTLVPSNTPLISVFVMQEMTCKARVCRSVSHESETCRVYDSGAFQVQFGYRLPLVMSCSAFGQLQQACTCIGRVAGAVSAFMTAAISSCFCTTLMMLLHCCCSSSCIQWTCGMSCCAQYCISCQPSSCCCGAPFMAPFMFATATRTALHIAQVCLCALRVCAKQQAAAASVSAFWRFKNTCLCATSYHPRCGVSPSM